MSVTPNPLVSVVLPCRNEERYIAFCLDSILATSYPLERLEILVVDGMSDDRTRSIVEQYARRYSAIRVLDNSGRITPAALNTAIRAARGDVIVRMDAHVIYPREYLPRLVNALQASNADNVGGVIATLPADNTVMARAIALALSHPFGVGNAYFRIGVGAPRWVDSVPFGCFRRDLFERIGLFDEELVRNQDDEFNMRLIKRGGRILLLPDVVSYYFARRSLRDVARMFYQYGYYKPLVAKKLDRVMTARQLVPGVFLFSLLLTGLLAPWVLAARVAVAAIGGSYLAAALGCAVSAARRDGWRCILALVVVFPTLHLSYGFGSLRGVLHHVLQLRRGRADPAMIPLSR